VDEGVELAVRPFVDLVADQARHIQAVLAFGLAGQRLERGVQRRAVDRRLQALQLGDRPASAATMAVALLNTSAGLVLVLGDREDLAAGLGVAEQARSATPAASSVLPFLRATQTKRGDSGACRFRASSRTAAG
jgi:hypothetical protein